MLVYLATVGVPMLGGVLLWCLAGRLADKLHASVEQHDVVLGVLARVSLGGVSLLALYRGSSTGGLCLGLATVPAERLGPVERPIHVVGQ